MSLPRLWRTVRHLTARQWLYRALALERRAAMRRFPRAARRQVETAAARLPLPDPGAPHLEAVARPVLALQEAVHGGHLDGIAGGRFVLLNRPFDFGGIDGIPWRGDFAEGSNPLRRMNLSCMGYAVPLLSRGRKDDLTVVLRLLQGMEDANPWSAAGVFRDVWSPYAASHRLINLLSALALYRAAGGAPAAAAESAILRHVRFCAAFVRANLERDLQYNHLLKNLVALAAYSAAVRALPPSFAFLRHAIPRVLRRTILADGGHAERSPMYHLLSLLDIDVLRASAMLEGEAAAQLEDSRCRMAAALGAMSHPDGEIALFNDAWLGEAPPAGAVAGLSPLPEIARLRETGYVRLGWGGDAVLFDCGPCGPDDNPGHAHADFLSIEASVGGARLIVDPGVETYTEGPGRDLCRSAASHNGPHLRGEEPIEFWKSFRVGRRGRAAEITDSSLAGIAPLWCAGRHDGYVHLGVEARRFVGLWPGAALLVADVWTGPVARAAATSFLIPALWSPEGSDGMAYARNGTRVRLTALKGRREGVRSDHHRLRFGVAEPAHRVTFLPDVCGPYRGLAIWFGWSDAANPPDGEAVMALLSRLGSAGGNVAGGG